MITQVVILLSHLSQTLAYRYLEDAFHRQFISRISNSLPNRDPASVTFTGRLFNSAISVVIRSDPGQDIRDRITRPVFAACAFYTK
jgi:hypothetical protein